jgi:transposase-like protein
MQERPNEEIRRRERGLQIFPNDESALRLIGALLADRNEVWLERKYLDMTEFMEWVASRVKHVGAQSGRPSHSCGGPRPVTGPGSF